MKRGFFVFEVYDEREKEIVGRKRIFLRISFFHSSHYSFVK